MMTFILVASGLMIAFIGLLRYDIHKHKHNDRTGNVRPETDSAQQGDAEKHNDANKT